MQVISAVACNMGKLRENNEDNFYYNGITLPETETDLPFIHSNIYNGRIQFYAICDGMGGEEHGEIASSVAVNTLEKFQEKLNLINYHDFNKYMDMYIAEANARICEIRKEYSNCRMGTTLAMIAVEGDILHILNIGDSRVYNLRKGKLIQLSEDHTPAARAYKMGNITKEEMKIHPHRNKLTQYLGISPEEMIVKPYRIDLKAKNKERFLICSDGLTDMVSDEEICNILKQNHDEKYIANELVEKALSNGGRDNITVVVMTTIIKRKLFG